MDWKEHCPINEEERPVERQAWHAGWEYRMQHSGADAAYVDSIVQRVMEEYSPEVLSVWIQGYSAAGNLTD